MCNFVRWKDGLAHIFLCLMNIFVLSVTAGCGGSKPVLVVQAPSLETRKIMLKKELVARRDAPVVTKKGEVLRGYRDFLEKHKGAKSDLRVPALKRLGDLYMAQGHLRFLEEMEAYEIAPDGPPPVVDYQKAIDTYTELLRNHHDYRKNDQVLYALSRAYSETGMRDEALPLLEWLVKEFPDSPHRLEAYFRLGEYYFDRSEYDKAAEAYAQAATWDDSFFQDKARYKLGWTFFNLKKYPEAIHQFLFVVDQKTVGMTLFSPEEGSLVWEALTYVATSFRRLGGAAAAADYFQKNGDRRYEKDLYLMMGNHDMVEGKPHRGIETYRAFIASHPVDPAAPIFAAYVIEALQKLGDGKGAEAARIRLVQDYALKSPWTKANNETARARSRPLIKSELHRLALAAHAKAQGSQEVADYQAAAGWYRQFLSEFPEGEASREIHFLLGETLMSLQSYAEAGAAFEMAAYGQAGEAPDRKAAYAAVVAYEVVAYEKVETPSGSRPFIALSGRFAKDFPKDPQAPVVLFNVAEFMFEKEHYSEASVMLEKLLSTYPKHKTAAMARVLSAHSYMKGGDFNKAHIAYREALLHLPKDKKEARKKLSDLLATAIYKAATLKQEKGEIESAADLFQEVSRMVPTSDLAPEGLFEAGLLFEKLKQPETAIRAYRKLSQNYAKSMLAGEASLHAGLLYEQLGKRLQAAALFVIAAKESKDDFEAQKRLWRAGTHYEKLERWNKVVTTFLTFIQRFPKHTDTPEALFKMAEARQKQGREPAAAKLYQAVITRGGKTGFAAKARLWQAERSFHFFKAIDLKAPLSKNLKQKTKALKEVVELYTKAVKTGHAEVVAASAYQLGQAFEHFKTALLHAEQPKKLSEEQLEEYRFQLEEKAYPFEEKAIKAYESNVHRAQQSDGIYNEWVRKSYGRLADLRPARYRRKERSERIVSKIDSKSLPKIFFSGFSETTIVQVR